MTAATAATTRQTALVESGWGRPFRFVQPRNLCFWVMILGWVMGGVFAFTTVRPDFPVYSTALTAGLIVFALYTVPWWLYLNHLNRLAIVPPRMTLLAFLWGALAATFFLALQANNAVLDIYGKTLGHAWVKDFGPGLTAPFTEETAKMLGVVLLIGLAPTIVRTPFHGFILGAFVGLGFEVAEDVMYAFQGGASQFGSDQVGLAVRTLILRGASGLFSHVMFSAIFCAGLLWLLNRDRSDHRLRGILLMLLAMAFHATWDTGGSYLFGIFDVSVAILVNYAATIILSLITIRWLVRTLERRAGTWITAVLEPEVAEGNLLPVEVKAIAGRRKDRRLFRRSLAGHRNKSIGKHVIAAGEDLARAVAHADGRDTEEVRHARAEVQRIRSGTVAT